MRPRTAPGLFASVTLVAATIAQGPPANGPARADAGWFALTGARVVTAPGQVLERATLVVRDGRVAALGDAAPPAGATLVDCSGLTIYPGLVEPFYASDVPALDESTDDQHWSPMLQPQRDARDGGLVAAADRAALRGLGFTTVACAPSGGILKGTATVVALDEPTPGNKPRIVQARAYAVASLQRSRDGYPGSEMGAIALLRQTLLDGQWYERCQLAVAADPTLAARAPQPSAALQALVDSKQLPLWLDSEDELQALRLLRVAAEAGLRPVVIGSGMEFRRLEALAAQQAPIVVPLLFPDAPDVATAAKAEAVSLRQLQTWEQAPTNSKRLLDAGVVVAWTTARQRDRKDFPAAVRKAIACGVSLDQALACLTTVPAELLGIADRAGTIAVGRSADLVVVDGELFAAKATIREVWVGGVRHGLAAAREPRFDGAFRWVDGWPATTAAPTLTIDGDRLTAKCGDDSLQVADVARDLDALTFRLAGKPLGDVDGIWLRLRVRGDGLAGSATTTAGATSDVTFGRGEAPAAKPAKDDEDFVPPALTPLPTPLGGYGTVEPSVAMEFAIVGATLWTSDGRGVLRNGAVVVQNGRIVFAGAKSEMPALGPSTAVIDGEGKHVTPGLIDCHSHTGISRGVNEGGQAVTAEVRVQDVLNPDDVNWYRQLAGGVTTVNQLHGSANTIGGQSCTTKVRYRVHDPEAMHFAGAPAGIKFALGENPRGANDRGPTTRYPATRMGVEALLRDRFVAAERYRREVASYDALPPKQRALTLPPRRDLELEALAEVLADSRRIHCHSYRQDEIFMLCGLVQEYGIKVGTFQHCLEGYKVADAIRRAALGASSFSDWWAYKFEVYDAIPDNGAIMHEAGVVVSFNSDSDELARRLNTEAGKAVKYGGLAPWEALDFVTRNPALQLGIFERTGSLTAGKDADVVLWSGDPLSYAARCEATWVDGVPQFSLARDAELRACIRQERTRLLQRALAAGGKGRKAKPMDPKDAYWAAEDDTGAYCCRTAEDAR
ncbi:MAG: amidohydrolase family protein [Planctomycetes bacterium]|nr:amidohydrolase family protein [Planctomycetota bacterium]